MLPHLRWMVTLLALGAILPAQIPGPLPLTANFQDSASYRWLNKKVLAGRLLDDMSSLDRWTAFTNNPPALVDSRVKAEVSRSQAVTAEITLTREQSRNGGSVLRLRTPTKLNVPAPANGRGWGETGVTRRFDGENWSSFNRISVWIYPDSAGAYVTALGLALHNDGLVKVPPAFGQEGETNLVLRNHEWNHVVWEIGNVSRDKITALDFSYYMAGNEPEAADTATYYFDRLELQQVDPDYIEGWGVWPGRISYSHAGYQPGSRKTAIAGDLTSGDFHLIDQATGQTVLWKPLQSVKTSIGLFQVMDFSEVQQPGWYRIESGGEATRPFRIASDVWRETILKALNFFYVERCGMAIPGVHGVCHRDWQSVHGDKRIVISGGWHDAGDLTQGMGNTGDIVYAMFSLAERLHAQGADPQLYDRLIEEARWGLDWVLKTSFGDGYRNAGSVSSRRTDGILGTFDDVTSTARNDPFVNFLASAAEAIGARVLKDSDPRLSAYALKMAESDWAFAVEGMAKAGPPSSERFHVAFDSAGVVHEVASEGVLASVELWRATANPRYADQAVKMAQVILDSQERKRPDWTVPLLGFFYTSPAKDRILHYVHRGRENAPILALTRLCDAFPDHPDWMKWYSAVAQHSEYLKSMVRNTEPYGVLPASIYKDDEYQDAPESRKESFRQQVLNGVPLGSGYYLRRLAVWMDYRGEFGTILPQAEALGLASHLRGNLDAEQLAQQQLEWVVGRNPFSQSMMWGEGYDFTPQYSPSSGDIVGSLPVGIQSRGDSDVPYWPVQNTWTYKEVWVHPVGRWIAVMRDLDGPALVEGQAAGPVVFQEKNWGRKLEVQPDPATGNFRTYVPEGRYTVRSRDCETARTFLSAGTYNLNLLPGQWWDLQVSSETTAAGDVTVKALARGRGVHRLQLRAENLTFSGAEKEVLLQSDGTATLEWRGHVAQPRTPWIAVVVPDGDLSGRREIMGSVWK
ncbi:MAG: glycoside hydrolase family 9 protein [Bryobacteraceae bacterium]